MTKPTPAPEAAPSAEIIKSSEPLEFSKNDPLAGLIRGRIVNYRPLPYEARNADAGPWPAMVTHVGDGGICTLNVNMPVPTMIGSDPVARRAEIPYSAEDVPGTWCWPERT